MKLGGGKAPVNCTVGLEISSSGAWVLKFRPIGLIVNNRELLLDDIKVDANLKFSDCGSFWRLINGLATTDEEVKDGSLVANGNQDYVEFLRLKCVKAQEKQSLASVDNVPIRETRQFTTTSEQPLKAGWLLKKREILAGWRCRYFVVYKDRIEYFVDPHDVRTRGVISLVGASVLPLKKVSINGVSDYWEIP